MTAIFQYLIYLCVSWWYFLLVTPVITYGSGLRIWGLPLLLFPFVLGSYLSGLSFVAPRTAATSAIVMAAILLLVGLYSHSQNKHAIVYQPSYFLIPSFLVLGISLLAFRNFDGSLWSRAGRIGRVTLALLGAIPAVIGTWLLVMFGAWLFGLDA